MIASRLKAQGSGFVTGVTLSSLIFLSACAGPNQPAETGPDLKSIGGAAEKPAASPPPPAPYYVYVTNEQGGNLTVIHGGTNEVIETIALGKRPRGIKVSPDGTQLFVALSGSPIAGPGVDESKLPPPDKAADGIGVVDIASRKVVKMLHGGSDPEQIALSQDGSKVFASNEDAGGASIIGRRHHEPGRQARVRDVGRRRPGDGHRHGQQQGREDDQA